MAPRLSMAAMARQVQEIRSMSIRKEIPSANWDISRRFISHLRQNSPSVQQTQREQKTQAVLLSEMARLLMQKAL